MKIIYNPELAREIGVKEALTYTILLSLQKSKGKGFPTTIAYLCKYIPLSSVSMQKILRKLREKGLITTTLKGIPPVLHFEVKEI